MPLRCLAAAVLLACAFLFIGEAHAQKMVPRRSLDTNADNRRAEEAPAPATPAAEPAQAPASTPVRIEEEAEVERNLRQGDAQETSRPEDRVDASGQPAAVAQWYGYAFVYVVSSTGVRVAIDPFQKGSVSYDFPRRLPADLVLVSNESDGHSAAEQFVGSPQVFRSVYAVGLNRANGMLFKGVEVSKERRSSSGGSKSTGFAFEFDGVKFAHLGAIGDTLNSAQRNGIGRADVLFLGVGDKNLSPESLQRIIKDVQAKIIVPITYGSPRTPGQNLRTLEEFLEKSKLPVREIDANQFKINRSLLPDTPTIYVLKAPEPKAGG